MCESGSGTEAPKHMAGEVSVAHVDLGCLFSFAFWEVFCGRASEYKRVTTANNNLQNMLRCAVCQLVSKMTAICGMVGNQTCWISR